MILKIYLKHIKNILNIYLKNKKNYNILNTLKKLQNKYKIILFENIGHSSHIIENILIKHTPLFVNKSVKKEYRIKVGG